MPLSWEWVWLPEKDEFSLLIPQPCLSDSLPLPSAFCHGMIQKEGPDQMGIPTLHSLQNRYSVTAETKQTVTQ
jgi:hypothetical protein